MSKEFYRKNLPENTPFFHQPFWLDMVCDTNWDVILVLEGEKIVGSFVYHFSTNKLTSKIDIKMPLLTFNTGPYLHKINSQASNFEKISSEIKFLEQIQEKLPEFSKFHQKWDAQQQNWLPFYWNEFTQTTRYSYVIDDISDLDQVWDNFKGSVRTDIRKAEKQIKVIDGGADHETFYSLFGKTFERQNMKKPYSKKLIEKVVTGCVANGSGKLFLGVDENNTAQCAVFIVWDKNKAYYLLGATDPAYRSNGANSLLLWEAIKFCSSFVKCFDFEGSMVKNIEYFFRSFGAAQKPYFEITKGQTYRTKLIEDAKKGIKKIIRKL